MITVVPYIHYCWVGGPPNHYFLSKELRARLKGLGFRVWGLGFRVWGSGLRVQGLGQPLAFLHNRGLGFTGPGWGVFVLNPER